jgi:hypothetical protein
MRTYEHPETFEAVDMPYLSDTDSAECLDNGLVCSVDPNTGRCTECDGLE